MNKIVGNILSFFIDFLEALPIIIILALAAYIFELHRTLAEPNPFNRCLGKKPYSIYSYSSKVELCIKGRKKKSNTDILETALFELYYLNQHEYALEVRDYTDYRQNIACLEWCETDSLDLSQLPQQYNEDFNVAHPNVKRLCVPPYSRAIYFFVRPNKNLQSLVLDCPKPISAHIHPWDSGPRPFAPGPIKITVAPAFCVYVPVSQLQAYEQAESWQRLNFRTEDGTPVPLRFEALR